MIHKKISYRRDQRARHIARRKNICHHQETFALEEVAPNRYRSDCSRLIPMEWYDCDGKYNKGKIHCGCPICKPYKPFRRSWKEERADREMDMKEKDYVLEQKEEADGLLLEDIAACGKYLELLA